MGKFKWADLKHCYKEVRRGWWTSDGWGVFRNVVLDSMQKVIDLHMIDLHMIDLHMCAKSDGFTYVIWIRLLFNASTSLDTGLDTTLLVAGTDIGPHLLVKIKVDYNNDYWLL